MRLTRPAAPEECCIDCCRKFDPGEHGFMLNPSIGPFIACLDREACDERAGGRPDEALPDELPEMPPPLAGPGAAPLRAAGKTTYAHLGRGAELDTEYDPATMVARVTQLGLVEVVRDRVALVPDFPRPGVQFRDITPLLADARALRAALLLLERDARALRPDLIVGVESRGFIFGVPLADRLGVGFLPARKPIASIFPTGL
jgi:hypothetical protein